MQTLSDRQYRGFSLRAWFKEFVGRYIIADGYQDGGRFHHGEPPARVIQDDLEFPESL